MLTVVKAFAAKYRASLEKVKCHYSTLICCGFTHAEPTHHEIIRLGYENVYLSPYKVAYTPFRTQGDVISKNLDIIS